MTITGYPGTGLLLTVALLLGGLVEAHADPAHSPIWPDSRLTPGDVLTTDVKAICAPGYTQTVRAVPQSLKHQVYRQYGITSR
jgi:hypothetical protein